MHQPAIVDCPADIWTLIVPNVKTGQVHLKDAGPGGYLQTYRPTGEAPPTEQSEGVKIGADSAFIESTFGIDVYIMPLGANGVVRVDIAL